MGIRHFHQRCSLHTNSRSQIVCINIFPSDTKLGSVFPPPPLPEKQSRHMERQNAREERKTYHSHGLPSLCRPLRSRMQRRTLHPTHPPIFESRSPRGSTRSPPRRGPLGCGQFHPQVPHCQAPLRSQSGKLHRSQTWKLLRSSLASGGPVQKSG